MGIKLRRVRIRLAHDAGQPGNARRFRTGVVKKDNIPLASLVAHEIARLIVADAGPRRPALPRQIFLQMAHDDGWAKLARNLKAEIDAECIEGYWGTVSLTFEPGEHKRIAVKIVDDRGIEV